MSWCARSASADRAGPAGRLALALGPLLGDDRVVDPPLGAGGAHDTVVVVAIEVHGGDFSSSPRAATASRVGARKTQSLRSAPSVTQPTDGKGLALEWTRRPRVDRVFCVGVARRMD